MIKQILTHPHPLLRKKAKKVDDFSAPEIKRTIANLKETLQATKEGLGLAAPQIGESWRIFVLDWEGELKIFINPEITHFSQRKALLEEGCLSVPGKIGYVERSTKVVLKAQDQEGKRIKIKAKGLLAQAFQHEIDHLEGILYIDKAQEIKEIRA